MRGSAHRDEADRGVPSPAELLRRAEALVPYLEQNAEVHREERRITEQTVARIRDAGLFRLLQPKRYGGYELALTLFADVQMTLSRGDPSMGFVFGVLSVHAFHMGFYDDRAAREVWGDNPDVLIGSPYIPAGRARRVEGGYVLSGRWPFSSGCDNCGWTFLAGTIEGEEHLPLLARMHAFLLPRADAPIVDTWRVMGLQGTGSKDIEVTDAFVPDYRVERFPITNPAACPGVAFNSGPLFRTPFLPLFYRAVSNAAIGALEGMIKQFCAFTDGRLTVLSEVAARDSAVQLAVAQAQAGVDEMKGTLHRDFADMESTIASGLPFAPARLATYMLHSTNVPHRAADLALGMLRAAGANGIRTDRHLARYYNDIVVIGQHGSNSPRTPGTTLGKLLLGVAA